MSVLVGLDDNVNSRWKYSFSAIEGGDFFLKQAKRTLAAFASARLYLCSMFEFLFLSIVTWCLMCLF